MKTASLQVTLLFNKKSILSMLLFLLTTTLVLAQNSLGSIIDNTNLALPSSYNIKEYVFAEPDDQGTCLGLENTTAQIAEVYLAQTHRNAIDHPLFFTIGHRPALLQLAVEGIGAAPDVQVEGFFQEQPLGKLCLSGPTILKETIDLNAANLQDYFSVTLPKSWMKNGLELVLTAGNITRTLTAEELKIGPYTELNLVMVTMDVMDYNDEPHFTSIFDTFLQEVASAIPASVIRFGEFPEVLKFPELVASNDEVQLLRLKSVAEIAQNGIMDEGKINSVAMNFISNLHKSTGDYLSTVYFGNTLNLAPGGWGGGGSFVSPEFTDVFIHELGHALSLLHWEETFGADPTNEDSFIYPYGGEDGIAGGRGDTWNFIQDVYEFEDSYCRNPESEQLSLERSDAMQREINCLNERANGFGPWDGFGNYSTLAMHRYLIGANVKRGTVKYRGKEAAYQLPYQDGFPTVSLVNGKREYTRDDLQPKHFENDDLVRLPWVEKLNQEVYLIYGTAHKTQPQANIVYEPIKYNGTLIPVIDPTNPVMFTTLKNLSPEAAPNFFGQNRDLTVKITYEDGTFLHAIIPFDTTRETDDDLGNWRQDLSNFSLVIPGAKKPCKVEVFDRPFIVEDANDLASNINSTSNTSTAQNFMETARLIGQYDCGLVSEPQPNVVTETVFYPNPFSNSFNVDTQNTSGGTVSLFDFSGQLIATHPINNVQTTIPAYSLSSGIYVAMVKDENGTIKEVKKLIRN